MYYHATASGKIFATPYSLSIIDFRMDEAHSCIIYSNAPTQAEAWQGRQRMLLRLTQRRLEQWLSLEVLG